MTWAGDNNIYTIWDDGGGLSPGSSTVCRTQFGVAKMTGSSGSSPGFVPIFGCQADGDGCLSGATHDAGCDAPYASTIAGYGEDILAIDNTLYSIATLSNYTPRRVAVNRKWFSENSPTATTAAVFSSAPSCSRFTTGRPREVRSPSGIWYTFSQRH
jgi:hypothetical protein